MQGRVAPNDSVPEQDRARGGAQFGGVIDEIVQWTNVGFGEVECKKNR